MPLHSQRLATPLGAMLAVADDRGLVLCEYIDKTRIARHLQRVERLCRGRPVEAPHPILDQTQRELNEYFLGQREEFTVPLVLGGSPFQSAVWNELRRIPFGKTVSYDSIATQLQRPGGARAVGRANGDNRIAIIVPCHRVIDANGSLSGYGGGRHRKRWLISHEKRGVQLTLGPDWE